MKKTIFVFLLVALMIGMMSVPAFARGCGGGGYGRGYRAVQQQTRYEVCGVDGCTLPGLHEHDGTWYCGPAGDWSDYEVCTVEGCTLLGLHEHDGTYYHCAYSNTGNGCGRW